MEQPAAEQEKQAGGREYLSCISDVVPPPSLVEDRDRRYGEIDGRKTFRRESIDDSKKWLVVSGRFRGMS
jgi:hypothetical protein